ncbi:hypothetical protein SK128_017359 [Halocaridina rubra]|uniref:Sushi domain-containing protein n=1 Tax=Halocaridina rubra TaxID=373956 RepID=A0AAN8WYS5_HALRR
MTYSLKEPPSKQPESTTPSPTLQTGRCPPPPDIERGYLVCHPPIQEFPRRDLIPKDDPNVYKGASELGRPALKLSLHPVGTVCKVKCGHGRVLRRSDSGRASITCTSGLTWHQRPPECHLKVAPVVRQGDCEDETLLFPLTLHKVEALQHPVFFTSSGETADVTCSVQEIEPGTYYKRACIAWDTELRLSAECQHNVKSNISEKKCSDLKAPENGDLLCREDEHGDILCDIICRAGFQSPIAFTRCPKATLLWDFQEKEGEELPACISQGSPHVPEENPSRFLPSSPRPEEIDVSFPKNTRFKTVADVFENKVNRHFLPQKNDPEEGADTSQVEKPRYNHSDEQSYSESASESSEENLNDLNVNDFDYYYDALEDYGNDPDYYFEDIDYKHGSLHKPMKSLDANPNISEVPQEELNLHTNTSTDSTESYLPGHKPMLKMMFEDTAEIFSSTRGKTMGVREPARTNNDNEINRIPKGGNRKSNEQNAFEDRLGDDIINHNSHISPAHKKNHAHTNINYMGTLGHHYKTVSRSSGHTKTSMMPAKEALETYVEESDYASMEAIIELEVLVAECSESKEALEALAQVMMEQDACRNITCNKPETNCRNDASNEGVVKVVWTVGGPYQPIEDYYYDDLQVPMVEAIIETLVASTERLLASEGLTRILENYGAAVDLTSFTLSRLDLSCKRPGLQFDPASSKCQRKRH